MRQRVVDPSRAATPAREQRDRARTRRSRDPIRKPHVDRIREAVAAQLDATLKELKDKLGLEMSPVTLHRALHALKLTVKKSSGLRSRTVPMSLKNVATGEIGKAS